MTLQTLQTVILHPLLWWLLSVAIVIWAVLATPTQALQGDVQKQYWADRFIILLLIFTAALFGGDLYVSVTDYIAVGFENVFTSTQLISGEKGSIGAIMASTIVVYSYLTIRKIPVLVYADALVPFAALAYAIARIGCFANGDDFGFVSNLPWSVTFGPSTEAYITQLGRGWIIPGDSQSLSVHPTQLYHAFAGLAGFFLLKAWSGNWQGDRFAVAWVYYGLTRFFIQFFRDDHWVGDEIIDTAQWFCLLFIVFGLLMWFYHKLNFNRERPVVAG